MAVELAAEQRGDVAQRLVEEIRVLPAFLGAEQHVEDLVGGAPGGGDGHGRHINPKWHSMPQLSCEAVRLEPGYFFRMGETIEFGSTGGYLATPEMGRRPGPDRDPGADGTADHGHDVCDRFADRGFHRPGARPAATGRRPTISTAAIDLLKPHQAVRGQGIGVVGFATGAGLALWLGTHRPEDVVAVVAVSGTYRPRRSSPTGRA